MRLESPLEVLKFILLPHIPDQYRGEPNSIHTQDKEWKDMVTQQTQSSFPLGDLVSQENWSKINLVG